MKTGWGVTLQVLSTNGKKIYKVTRQIPTLLVSETKVFASEEKAYKQFQEWS